MASTGAPWAVRRAAPELGTVVRVTHKTKVTLLFQPDCTLPRAEHMWAEQLDHRHFKLLNTSFFAPLCVEDIVETRPFRDTPHAITRLFEPSDLTLSVTQIDPIVSTAEACRVTEGWQVLGASWTEGVEHRLNTVWHAHVTPDRVFALIANNVRGHPGWHMPVIYGPMDRTNEAVGLWAHLPGV